ncbi:MAG: 30S ribosomal protein S6 [Nitrospinae bacterium]|nr:30S ribosomal protein S6 [Nitrospinota bacterium]
MILKDYESLLILKPDLSEDDVTGVVGLVTTQIAPHGGAVVQEERWGKRRLAYTVKKQKYGYYLLLRYTGAAADITEIERSFRFSDNVLKFLTVYFDEAAGRIPEGAEPRVLSSEKDDD